MIGMEFFVDYFNVRYILCCADYTGTCYTLRILRAEV